MTRPTAAQLEEAIMRVKTGTMLALSDAARSTVILPVLEQARDKALAEESQMSAFDAAYTCNLLAEALPYVEAGQDDPAHKAIGKTRAQILAARMRAAISAIKAKVKTT